MPPAIAGKPVQETTKLCRGLVLNIMRFALHDGPGIRTTVFLKGCPLSCWWCHNPEGRSGKTEVVYVAERCIRCGDCVRACSQAALALKEQVIRDSRLCRKNTDCVKVCPTGAQEVFGRYMTVAEVMKEVLKDQVFFDESGGGMTLSGGEPLMQAEFALALLAICRSHRIHTVVDTCGDAEWQDLDRIRRNVDLFLFDLKIMDPVRHEQFTGARNNRILANLRLLAEHQSTVIVRIPVIPGVNDGEDNLAAVSGFLSPLGLQRIDLLPYHQTAMGKYSRLGLTYRMAGVAPPSEEHLQTIAARLTRDGFRVGVGGIS